MPQHATTRRNTLKQKKLRLYVFEKFILDCFCGIEGAFFEIEMLEWQRYR